MAASAVCAPHAAGQNFVYVEPGVASCLPPPAALGGTEKTVQRGVALAGRITVRCGFDQGSYTVTLNSSDPGATFVPTTFLVNFGRLVGNGAYAVTFSAVGVHSISAAITSNMGSPPVRGRFASAASEFKVVPP